MAIFELESGANASLHTTLTQWKNTFQFEVFGDDGYIIVDGLGSSYGTEKLIFGKRDFTGPFSDQITEFRRGDISWREEWIEFTNAIKEGRQPIGNGDDGLAVMRIALASYESQKTKKMILL